MCAIFFAAFAIPTPAASAMEIQATEQRRQLFAREFNRVLARVFGPVECSALEPLRAHPKPATVKVKHLDAVATLVAKYVQVTRDGVAAELASNQRAERVEALSHVRVAHGQEHPRGRRCRQHARVMIGSSRARTAQSISGGM